jgi:hypothetical protein
MPGAAWIAIGLVLMALGTLSMWGWLSGKSHWFGQDVYDDRGSSKSDRLLLYVTFLAMVLAPLLCGAVLIMYGLYRLR